MYEDIAARYIENEGADGVILGCTEVGMLLNQGNVGVDSPLSPSQRWVATPKL